MTHILAGTLLQIPSSAQPLAELAFFITIGIGLDKFQLI